MGENRPKIGFFKLLDNLVINCSAFDLWWNFVLYAVFLLKSHIWEKAGYKDMGPKLDFLQFDTDSKIQDSKIGCISRCN